MSAAAGSQAAGQRSKTFGRFGDAGAPRSGAVGLAGFKVSAFAAAAFSVGGGRGRDIPWHITGQKTPEELGVRDWTQQSSFSSPIKVDPADPAKKKLLKHVGMHYVSVQGNRAYLSYHQAGVIILDVSSNKNPRFVSRLDYLVPDFASPVPPDKAACDTATKTSAACGNAHATKVVPGRNLLMVSDEYFSCPYGHVRIVDISDETNPRILSHFLTDQNMQCNGTAPANPARFPRRGPSSHLGNAWGANLYFMAWYGMGVRAIDLSDPTHPVEAGFFEYEIDPSNTTYNGSDTYDVLIGPEGYLYVSDGTSGLRVLKYTGRGVNP